MVGVAVVMIGGHNVVMVGVAVVIGGHNNVMLGVAMVMIGGCGSVVTICRRV